MARCSAAGEPVHPVPHAGATVDGGRLSATLQPASWNVFVLSYA